MVNATLPPPLAAWLRREILSINQQHFAHRDDLKPGRQYFLA
jgi:hypothetical protein